MSKYKPTYIDYWRKSGSRFNIDDYTRLVGSRMFTADRIYQPLTVSVSMNPDVAYNLEVDTNRADWNEVLCEGVKAIMDVPSHVDVSIRDGMGRDLSTLSLSELRTIGLAYPHIEDKGRFATNKIELGDEREIPALLSTNKQGLFHNWMDAATDRIVDDVAASLTECAGVAEVGDRLTLSSKNSIKGTILSALYPGFKDSVDLHTVNPDANEAELVDQTANLIMAAVVEGFKHNKGRVRDFFHAKSLASQANASPRKEEDRNMFIESDLPVDDVTMDLSADQLFADIIQGAIEKENIGKHVYYMMVRGSRKHSRGRGIHRHTHHHHKKKTHVKTHRHHRRKPHHGRKYEIRSCDKDAYRRTLERGWRRRGRPRYRKTKRRGHPKRGHTEMVEEPTSSVQQQVGSLAPGLYSAEAPSLEPVPTSELTSVAPLGSMAPGLYSSVGSSLEPIPRDSITVDDDMPSLEFGEGVPSLEPVQGEWKVPELEEAADIEAIWSDEDVESPPALEAVGDQFSSDEDAPAPMRLRTKPKPKFRGTTAKECVVEPVREEAVFEVQTGGLPSLSNMKKELGLPSQSPTSGLMGSYSASIDGPIFGHSMAVASHYARCCKKHRRRKHHHHHKRRCAYILKSKGHMSAVQSQEIQEYDNPTDVEDFISPFVASSYEDGVGGTIAFTTADGKTHKIRGDGVHFVDGTRLPKRVSKLVEQDICGRPMLLVLDHN